MSLLILLAEAITKDGGLSADYALVIAITIVGLLISVIFGFILSQINSIKEDVRVIRTDFHEFVEEQKGLNATFHERTKDL